jgi:hypothetical protein
VACGSRDHLHTVTNKSADVASVVRMRSADAFRHGPRAHGGELIDARPTGRAVVQGGIRVQVYGVRPVRMPARIGTRNPSPQPHVPWLNGVGGGRRCCAGGDHATFVNTQEVIELAAAKDIELEELGEVRSARDVDPCEGRTGEGVVRGW